MSKAGKGRTQPTGNASSVNHGVKNINKVGNQCPSGAGTGNIGAKVGKVNPHAGSKKGSQ